MNFTYWGVSLGFDLKNYKNTPIFTQGIYSRLVGILTFYVVFPIGISPLPWYSKREFTSLTFYQGFRLLVNIMSKNSRVFLLLRLKT